MTSRAFNFVFKIILKQCWLVVFSNRYCIDFELDPTFMVNLLLFTQYIIKELQNPIRVNDYEKIIG